jgi:chemotaxis protein MotB
MARKKKHEEHVNAEAWAIPYGDLVTLLFALFTVMYAMSSVNEGKFRVLSDSLIAAFRGSPKTMQPVNIGEKTARGGDKPLQGVAPTVLMRLSKDPPVKGESPVGARLQLGEGKGAGDQQGALMRMEREVQSAMQQLVDAKLVSVKRENQWLEIEINTDILFPSGGAGFSTAAEPVLDKLAEVLKPFPNPIRVEGHTDNRPVHTAAYPSNWELSAARAASVVHQFTSQGIDPLRLEIVGFGEFHPRQANDSAEGRNANRRVAILVLEAASPGDAANAHGNEHAPDNAASGAGTVNSDGSHPAKVDEAALEHTVLTKDAAAQGKAEAAPGMPSPEPKAETSTPKPP